MFQEVIGSLQRANSSITPLRISDTPVLRRASPSEILPPPEALALWRGGLGEGSSGGLVSKSRTRQASPPLCAGWANTHFLSQFDLYVHKSRTKATYKSGLSQNLTSCISSATVKFLYSNFITFSTWNESCFEYCLENSNFFIHKKYLVIWALLTFRKLSAVPKFEYIRPAAYCWTSV